MRGRRDESSVGNSEEGEGCSWKDAGTSSVKEQGGRIGKKDGV